MNIRQTQLTILLLITVNGVFLPGCTNKNDNEDFNPQVDSSISGTIYFQGDDSIRSLDIQSGRFNWSEEIVDNFGSAYTVMNADSGYLYKSAVYKMAAYNMSTGQWLWKYTFGPQYSGGGGAVAAQSTRFADSMMYFVQSYPLTGVNLFCLNKKTGLLSWKQPILNGGGSVYTDRPLIVGDDIFSLGSYSGQQAIYCFNRLTGQQRWRKNIQGLFISHLRNFENSVIGCGTNKVISMNITDGGINWQTDLPAHSGLYQYSYDVFKDGNQTLVARSRGTTSSFSWVNNQDGSLAGSFTLSKDYTGCSYRLGKLYLFNAQQNDTVVHVAAYDARNMNALWTCKFPLTFVGTPTPWYYSALVVTDDKAIVGETFGNYPNAKTQFNIINITTGKLEKQVVTNVQGLTPSFIVVKDKKIYGPDRERQ